MIDKIDWIMDYGHDKIYLSFMHKTSNINIYKYHGNVEGFNGIHLFDVGNISHGTNHYKSHGTNHYKCMFENIDGILYVSSLSDYCGLSLVIT